MTMVQFAECPLHSLHERYCGLPVQRGTIYTAILMGVALGIGMEGKLDLLCEKCATDLKRCVDEVSAMILMGVALGIDMEGKLDLLCEKCAADLKRCKRCVDEVSDLLQQPKGTLQ
jgi:hypothetical protein